ncbi:MAG TPA: YqiJ family protein [Allosphingosinicella sp.]|jgi:membrane protein implicated in regulation of membrane protease activity
MLETIAAPANLPFSVALLVMLMIGAVEALGLGASAAHLDMDADLDGGGDLLGWLGFGRVPLLMLIVLFLAFFGLAGLAVQQFAGPLTLWIAVPAAAAAALPLTGLGARGLARVMPQDETTAISLDSLVGRRGTITVGTARRGSPAQARVRDVHGQVHYVMVEPYDDDHAFAEGETVRLDRRDGHIFIALAKADGLETRFEVLPTLNAPLSTRRD